MDDLSGMGKSINLESGSTSLGGIMAGACPTNISSWKCDIVNCPH
ncbi:hypothetical protein [Methanobacterium sp.]